MRVVFLDRDGVINKFPGHGNYVTHLRDFYFLPGALKAIKQLTTAGCAIFVVSNQAGVGRGLFPKENLKEITDHMLTQVQKTGGDIQKVFYCIHPSEKNCDCRKPRIGSLKKAFRLVRQKTPAPLEGYFVGDAKMDIEAGRTAGCTTILVLSGKETRRTIRDWVIQPDYIAKNLLGAIKIILNENSRYPRLRRRRTHAGR